MKKIIRMTESDLVNLVKKTILEQEGQPESNQSDGGKSELIQVMIDKLNDMSQKKEFDATSVAKIIYNNAAHFLNKTDIFSDQSKYGKPLPTKVPFVPESSGQRPSIGSQSPRSYWAG